MPSSLPQSPDGIGIAVVDVVRTDTGWTVGIAVPGDLHGPLGILQGGLSAALPRLVAAHLLDAHDAVPGLASRDITTAHSFLRRPTPVAALLYADVAVEDLTDIVVTVRNGDEVCIRGTVDLSGPAPVPLMGDLKEVVRQTPAPSMAQDAYPHCFVCGSDNARGLHILPNPFGSTGRSVTEFVLDERVDDGAGRAHPVAVSAILDCPGVWAGLGRVGEDPNRQVALLAEYRFQWFDHVELGSTARSVALVDDVDERLLRVRTALWDDQNRMRAMASAVHVFAPQMPPAPTAASPL